MLLPKNKFPVSIARNINNKYKHTIYRKYKKFGTKQMALDIYNRGCSYKQALCSQYNFNFCKNSQEKKKEKYYISYHSVNDISFKTGNQRVEVMHIKSNSYI